MLTNGRMPHCTNTLLEDDIPFITHGKGERYITGIRNGTRIGYKYFAFSVPVKLTLKTRGDGQGRFVVRTESATVGEISVEPSETWSEASAILDVVGEHALYLDYEGNGMVELCSFCMTEPEK